MTRGKHKSSAEARRAREDAIGRASQAERRLVALTAAHERTIREHQEALRRHEAEVAELRDEVTAVTSEALRAAHSTIEDLRRKNETAQAKVDRIQNAHTKVAEWLIRRLRADLNLGPAEGFELLGWVVNPDEWHSTVFNVGTHVTDQNDPQEAQRVLRIERARGLRTYDDTAEFASRIRLAWIDGQIRITVLEGLTPHE